MHRRHWRASVVCTILMPGFFAGVIAGDGRAAEQSFDSRGVEIAYIDQGAGEAVVLIHGFGLSANEMWMQPPFAPTPLIPLLAREYRVIAPDLRGHGASGKPHDAASYGAAMAEDVVRLLDHLGVSKAHVLGYSMGASVAGRLLASHPDRLLSVTFGGGGPVVKLSQDDQQVIDATATSLEKGGGCVPLVMSLAPEGGPRPNPFQASMISTILLRGKDKLALAAVMRGQAGLAVTEEELARSAAPVSFIYGDRESRGKLERITTAVAALPQAEVTALEGRDHVTAAPNRRFREALLKFVREHGDRGSATAGIRVQQVNWDATSESSPDVMESSAAPMPVPELSDRPEASSEVTFSR
jgi:pimeloyl-ACP methyl ester carboxylesterase